MKMNNHPLVSKENNSLYNIISRIYVDPPKFDRICRCNVELKFWLGIKWFVSLLKFYQKITPVSLQIVRYT